MQILASKKGIAVTAIILGAIAIASFSVWIIPQNVTTSQTITVSDFSNHIEGVENIHEILAKELEQSFQSLQDGQITAEQYKEIAENTSTQINSQIIELVESKAPEKWHQSYIDYIEALKTQNSLIRETTVAASIIEKQGQADFEASLNKIDELKSNMESLIDTSKQNKP